jgi:hypothetical protein
MRGMRNVSHRVEKRGEGSLFRLFTKNTKIAEGFSPDRVKITVLRLIENTGFWQEIARNVSKTLSRFFNLLLN